LSQITRAPVPPEIIGLLFARGAAGAHHLPDSRLCGLAQRGELSPRAKKIDGIELPRHMKFDVWVKAIPVAMLTSYN